MNKAVIDRSDYADLAPDCDTESDLSDVGDEIEELDKSNDDISDNSVDVSDFDQVDANFAIGRQLYCDVQ